MSSEPGVAGGPLAHLVWAKGGHAEVMTVTEDAIVLRSTTSAPPGARLEATLGAEPARTVKIKSHGSHKEADGSFTLKGRLIDATRDLREKLAGLGIRGSMSQK